MSDAPLVTCDAVCLDDTNRAAAALAVTLRRGDVVALAGELGVGKTAFVRALIGALSERLDGEVTSPTFTLMQSYPVTLRGEPALCWHADLYRLGDPAELEELGLEEAAQDGLLIVEWPEIAARTLPRQTLLITISLGEEGVRHIEYYGDASWRLRLAPLSATTSL